MISKSSTPSFTITIDDDRIIGDLIEKIVGVKNFYFESMDAFFLDQSFGEPIACFIDVHLAEGTSGLELIPNIKKRWPHIPVIMISADKEGSLIGRALALGAHDFISKPLKPEEVTGRLSVRRQELLLRKQTSTLSFGDISIDTEHGLLIGPLGKVHLAPKDVRILALLVRSEGIIVSRAAVKAEAWGQTKVSDNSLNRKVYQVKKHIKQVSDDVSLNSLYGKGIVLKSEKLDNNRILLDDLEVLNSKIDSGDSPKCKPI